MSTIIENTRHILSNSELKNELVWFIATQHPELFEEFFKDRAKINLSELDKYIITNFTKSDRVAAIQHYRSQKSCTLVEAAKHVDYLLEINIM